ncbi:MAG TPA: RluA family pseudouridine synthase [Rhodothermales bacterium]|nr:RluA family pseudouridine synthase [Rhodothermales bacterium]HRR08119.1 RluA family pseudouridine synthase [Rhodothermales bacterium]
MEPDKQAHSITVEVPLGHNTPFRLDVYLTHKLPNATRNKVQEGIKEGVVLVNGKTPKASQLVQPGDIITCVILRPPPIEALPEAIPLEILYEDAWLIVLNKQPGMVVHPAYGNRSGTLINALLHHVGAGKLSFEAEEDDEEEEQIGLAMRNAAPRYEGDPTIRPGLVHRLDKDTSGLMVIAKDDATHANLADQFAKRTIQRRYRAIVWGGLQPPNGMLQTQLGRDRRNRKIVTVLPEGQGKHAITHYETIATLQHFSLMEFRLETGRTHQIRAHARHLGHPIFGDETYGGTNVPPELSKGSRKAFFQNLFERLPRQALHAHTLGFIHPATGENLFFQNELPDDMAWVWERLHKMDVQLNNHPC